jgi:hypothetical protein
MSSKENILLQEVYSKISSSTIQEGLFDRTSANLSSLGAGLKQRLSGYKTGLKAAGQMATGNISKGVESAAAAKNKINQVGQVSLDAKLKSILASKKTKIASLSQDIANDLNRLGLSNKVTLSAEDLEALLSDSLNNFLNPSSTSETPAETAPVSNDTVEGDERFAPPASFNLSSSKSEEKKETTPVSTEEPKASSEAPAEVAATSGDTSNKISLSSKISDLKRQIETVQNQKAGPSDQKAKQDELNNLNSELQKAQGYMKILQTHKESFSFKKHFNNF